ncbi:RNA ligase/cyclic nucleotide phosphodiesterase [Mycena capillaripes]|nr:RNA ligase/cyclic nucleotide phosphodiesterase [Mycena capillaripes]
MSGQSRILQNNKVFSLTFILTFKFLSVLRNENHVHEVRGCFGRPPAKGKLFATQPYSEAGFILFPGLSAPCELSVKAPGSAEAKYNSWLHPLSFASQPFPGNTIISHISPSSHPGLYDSLLVLYDKLKNSHLSHLYVLLPPSSWHITVFEGVCDQVRYSSLWPDDLSIDASLEDCTSLYENKLSTFDLQCDSPYHLSVKGFYPLYGLIALDLEPSTAEENARIRDLRDRLSGVLRIRAGSHDTYPFHLTLAYLLRSPTKDQDKELVKLLVDHFEGMSKQLELGAPEFCSFEDMFTFKRLFYLKNQ